jgi:Tol biopolymer transport system component
MVKENRLRQQIKFKGLNLKIILILFLCTIFCPYTIYAGGVEEYTATVESYVNPLWSHDGKYLILSDNNSNGVYIYNTNDSSLLQITDAPSSGYKYNWAYDSKKIGFKLLIKNSDGTISQIPVVFDVKNNEMLSLHNAVNKAGVPSFSRDGHIAFTIDKELIVLKKDGTTKNRINLDNYANLTPLSPDGTKIVYNDANDQIWLIDIDGSNQKKLTSNEHGYFNPIWSPDGSKVVMSTLSGELKVIEIETSEMFYLDKGNNPSWSPDSKYILYSKVESIEGYKITGADIYLIKYDGSQKTPLTTTKDELEGYANWSPDGRKIAFVSYKSGNVFVAPMLTSIYITKTFESISLPQLGPIEKIQYRSFKKWEGKAPFFFQDTIANESSEYVAPLALSLVSPTISIGNVPYIHQVYDTPNEFNGHWACNASSALMAITYYGILPYWDCTVSIPYPHISHYGRYVSQIYSYNGYTYNIGSPDASDNPAYGGYGYIVRNNWTDTKSYMRDYLQNHGLTSSVDWSPTWSELQNEINTSYPLVLLTSLTTSGHYVLGIGYYSGQRTVIVNDPYGNKNQGYMNYNGAGVLYDWPGYNSGYSNLNTVHCFIYARYSASDTTPPTISAFDVTPRSATLGNAFTITYTVSDTGGSGLNRVELQRAPDNNGSPGTWSNIKTNSISGNGPVSGSFSDAPSSVGSYWYGIHAVDNAGNRSVEPSPPGPIKVTVTLLVLPPSAPTLSSPSNGATGISTSPTLSWNASSGATSYRLQVSTSNAFSTTVFDQSGITATSRLVSGLLNNTTYYWRVNACNAGGTSGWSSIWSFTTAAPAPLMISGYVRTSEGTGISGVVMSGLPGNPSTDANGYYSDTVNYGWSGTVTPTKAGYSFSPPSTSYSNVTSNQTTNYTGPLYPTFTISGYVRTSGGTGISAVVMSGLPGNPSTDASGSYSGTVNYGWSGTVTPTKTGYTFSPPSTSYSNVTSNQTTNYTGTTQTFTISGYVRTSEGTGISGVVMSGLPGNPSTDASGYYSDTVSYGWSGTVTPTKAGYSFSPPSTSYSNVTSNQTTNYTGTIPTFTISGYARTSDGTGISGVVMSGLPGNPSTDASGSYSGTVNYGWSGTVTPTKAGYTFSPPSTSYSNVTSNQTTNYTGTLYPTFTISGYVRTSGGTGISAVVMSGLPGNPSTDANGYYSASVNYGWSGTVTPTKTGYTFSPPSTSYSNVTSNQTTNYTGTTQTFTISGYVRTSGGTGISAVVMSGLPGNPSTDADGYYTGTVDYGWSGTITPTKTGYSFSLPSTSYSNVTSNQTTNYTGTLSALPPAPTAQAPANGGTVTTLRPTLQVASISGATQYNFRVYSSGNLVRDVNTTSNSWTLDVDLQNGAVHEWDCRAQNAAGWGSYFSPRWTFYIPYKLTIQINPAGGGTVSKSPEKESYSHGETVQLTASPSPGYSFSSWSGDVPSDKGHDNPLTIAMDSDKTVTANFLRITPPAISLSSSSFQFGSIIGGGKTSSHQLLITNAGGGVLDWTVMDDAAWLSCMPASGVGNAQIIVSVDATGLAAGTYTASITVSSTNATNSPQTVSVTLNVMAAGATSSPFGYFDTPSDGASVFGSVPITGWALDDIEVVRVEVKRSPHVLDNPIVIGADGLVFIGNAVFVEGARPDVANLYPTYPLTYRAGWGYMLLTNMLPNYGNGPYTLYAIAYDKEGNSVALGQKTISCNNADSKLPFGAIDTPAPGGTSSGAAYVNFGWALTPQPNMIPIDGSTINVWVDGVAIGRPVYNNYRSDIATKFPGYANSDGAVGYYYLDTTAYANRVHTIAWSVVDSGGNVTGIGSRFFTIFNSGTATAGVPGEGVGTEFSGLQGEERNRYRVPVFRLHTPLSWAHAISLPVSFEPVAVRRGYAVDAEPELIYPDSYGVMTIEIPEVERVEVHLGWDGAEDSAYRLQVPTGREEEKRRERLTAGLGGRRATNSTAKSSSVIYTGYMIVGDELKPLPIGSTLDSKRGIFSWQPGPGFLGAYDFVFVRESANGSWEKTYIKVKIVPKF